MTRPPKAAHSGRRLSLIVLLASEVAAMSTWFATTASLPAIRAQVALTPSPHFTRRC